MYSTSGPFIVQATGQTPGLYYFVCKVSFSFFKNLIIFKMYGNRRFHI